MRVFVLRPENPEPRNQTLQELASEDAPKPERSFPVGSDGTLNTFTRFVTEGTTGERIAIYAIGNSRYVLDRWLQAHPADLPAAGLEILYGGSVRPPV